MIKIILRVVKKIHTSSQLAEEQKRQIFLLHHDIGKWHTELLSLPVHLDTARAGGALPAAPSCMRKAPRAASAWLNPPAQGTRCAVPLLHKGQGVLCPSCTRDKVSWPQSPSCTRDKVPWTHRPSCTRDNVSWAHRAPCPAGQHPPRCWGTRTCGALLFLCSCYIPTPELCSSKTLWGFCLFEGYSKPYQSRAAVTLFTPHGSGSVAPLSPLGMLFSVPGSVSGPRVCPGGWDCHGHLQPGWLFLQSHCERSHCCFSGMHSDLLRKKKKKRRRKKKSQLILKKLQPRVYLREATAAKPAECIPEEKSEIPDPQTPMAAAPAPACSSAGRSGGFSPLTEGIFLENCALIEAHHGYKSGHMPALIF
ncbi:uncharacterized protein LOC134550666 [Prinia subflava]|uniref:uncharacterized protein LOC134550666 n=1 Tax=Prinia subflava TaxID=208062 RepID=UPI002FE01BE1